MLGGFRSLTTLACCVSVEVLPSHTLLLATCYNLFRHLHAAQGLVCPFVKLASRLTAQLCDAKLCRCCYSLQRITFAGKSAGRTELRKHPLFNRLTAGTWPCREWAAFVSCFFFSTLAHTSLLMSGGGILASRYSSSTLVGIKHPVIDLHASFSSGSSLEACGDLAQTGHAYSAAEYDSANAVVLIVIALQPHLEFDNFFRRLFRVATFNFVLRMCCVLQVCVIPFDF